MDIANIWTKDLFPGLIDYIIISVYLVIIFTISIIIQRKNQINNPVYRFYTWGLFVKIAGVIIFCLIYTLYYKGHDTTNYYRSSEALVNLLFNKPLTYLSILLGNLSPENRMAFDSSTGTPWYMSDSQSFALIRLTSIFTLLGFKNYFTASILIAWFAYTGLWRLYLVFTDLFKGLYKELAFVVLFFPSVVFWGSGILKDTFTLMAAGWFVYGFYHLFIKKNVRAKYIIIIIMSSFIMVSIKPYIFVALLPGSLIWASFEKIKKIKNLFIRIAFGPTIILAFLFIARFVLAGLSDKLEDYGTMDGIIEKAIVTQDDLTRAHSYGENYFDIGHLDGTIVNFISNAPQAMFAAMFRPFVWEGDSPLIYIAGIENMALILFCFWVLLRVGPIKFIRITGRSPSVIFTLLFALIFAFAVGVTTANFGALVRLKIPMLPFLGFSLMAINFYYRRLKGVREQNISTNFSSNNYEINRYSSNSKTVNGS